MTPNINLSAARQWLSEQTSGQTITASVVLGSGLGSLFDSDTTSRDKHDPLNDCDLLFEAPYSQIPGMPISTAPEHAGVFKLIKIGEKHIGVFQGRFHLYEGYSAREASSTAYLSRLLGAQSIVLTNAAGALNADFSPGDVMLVEDHLNFTGHSPLRGENDEAIGLRFPDMSRAYTPALQQLATHTAAQKSISLQTGIYAGVLGPELETSAERRFLRSSGADAVGMSLVIETIAAAHCGLDVLALSAITNSATGGPDQQVDTIEEVLENAAVAGSKMSALLPTIISQLY